MRPKYRMLDLFAGQLGWTQAFLARGWEGVAVDLVEPPNLDDLQCEYGEYGIDTGRLGFQRSDVMNLFWDGGAIWDRERGVCICHGPDFICASSPCEEFSVHGMKHFHPNPKYPENGIRLFNHTREICEASGVPYVMENVRAAQQFVGKAVHHCGPFYLWGTGVPAVMPQGITKGFDHAQQRSASERKRSHPELIPHELAATVCDYAERLLEQKQAGIVACHERQKELI